MAQRKKGIRAVASSSFTRLLPLLLVPLSLPSFAEQPCSWSSPGLTREEAYRSFAQSCTTPESRRTCEADFRRAEQEICRMTRSGQPLKPAPPCNWAELGVTREQGRQAYLAGCETAPPDKRAACKAAWHTHENEICQMTKEAGDRVLGPARR